VSAYDLMERAAHELFVRITGLVNRNDEIMIFAGPGNNGGDGLAIARMLRKASYRVSIFIINISTSHTEEWNQNLEKLNSGGGTGAVLIDDKDSIPLIPARAIVIDAIFGSGLSRPPEGLALDVIRAINESSPFVISIDVPSGLSGEDASKTDKNSIIKADHTLAIQFPRLSFMFSENCEYLGEWNIVPIGLHPIAIAQTITPYYYIEKGMVQKLIKKRKKFDHKGDYGHALLVAGSVGKMGAAVLAARAVLRCGAGLLTCHVPSSGNQILQISIPEAMTVPDVNELVISEIVSAEKYTAIAFGPGVGTRKEVQMALHNLISVYKGPLVIDADGINILGLNGEWLDMLPENSILTPHPKEFARIAGESDSSFERVARQRAFSAKYKCIVALKGAHTSVSLPDGRVFFNSTGNPGMATAGSGDVLTGIILGLLAQQYEAEEAAITGVYLHGLAGDIAAHESCQESIIASDIADYLFSAYTKIHN